MATKKDRKTVSIYMRLWETLNKSSSLREFEQKIIDNIYTKYKRDQVDLVLRDFFKTNGIEISIECSSDIYCFKKKVLNTEENIYIEFISKHFSEPRKYLRRVPKKGNLFYLESEQVDRILSYIEDATLSNSERQEIVKHSLRKILQLDKKDAIFFVNDKLFVRFFIKKVSKACEKRYNGIPEEEMEKLFEKFKDINYEHLIENIAENIISRYLNPKDVDNITFHKKLIPYFQRSINSTFRKHIEEPELLMGFTNYVLRQNFNVGIYYIANAIMEQVLSKDDKVKAFISFYDGGEYKDLDRKIKKSEIIAGNERWTYPPLFNLLNQKRKAEEQFFTKEEDISRFKRTLNEDKEKMGTFSKKIDDARIEFQNLKTIADKNLQYIIKLRKDYQNLQKDAKKGSDSRLLEAIEVVRKDIKIANDEDRKILKQREELEKSINKMVVERVDTEKRIDGANQKIVSEMEKTVKIKDDYLKLKRKVDEVTHAFATALMKFKL